ncbi:MAG TPA: sulfotransferase domain-containing protein [Chthoniobacterales bacterium]|nr:sulfotransferase domain-containing protein [Chthoniobacterales bacterium]
MKVDFVIGGTQKGGTSALDTFLRQHPQICMPADLKEVHFFDREEMFRGQKPDYEKYHAHFRCEPQHQVIGEASPIYMYWNAAPQRIWNYNPAMKWILILRNPIDRAYSAWNMERKRGADPLPFDQAVAKEAERCREALPLQHRVFSYIDRGFYSFQLRRLFDIFGRDNCLVLLNEDLQSEHDKTLQTVFAFLGIDQSVRPATGRVFEHEYEMPLDPSLRARLAETFSADIKQLERLLNRDLSHWYADQRRVPHDSGTAT